MTSSTPHRIRHLVIVLGDQLSFASTALADFDPSADLVVMAEVKGEGEHVWSHRARIAIFLAAMRHFAEGLAARGFPLRYFRIGAHEHANLVDAFRECIREHRPSKVVVCEPGEYRIERALEALSAETGVPLVVRDDTHFMISRRAFREWAGTRRQLLMETFYRKMRVDTGTLMDGREPVGGTWNFDRENRASFGRKGPGMVPAAPRFAPDAITREAIEDVKRHFADHPGSLDAFGWPVTREDALVALRAFVDDRLPAFGHYQDAMWTNEPFLYHSLLSAALNLKLLDPREVIAAAVDAYERKRAPLAAVEGFVRQILGWREFVRGVYWRDMPALGTDNHFGHTLPLPNWYWTAETGMNCMRAAIGETLAHGYAHHIQRLMITGNFALVAGLAPAEVCDWYLAVYVDAVEWVEHPNTAGMALYANGGRFTSKPYAASGAYIRRMSNYCDGCRYRPDERTGERACPVTTFYWDFLDRHEKTLAGNQRATLMLKNLARLDDRERAAIRATAATMRERMDSL